MLPAPATLSLLLRMVGVEDECTTRVRGMQIPGTSPWPHTGMVLAECLFRLAGDQAAAEDAVTYYKLCAGCVSGHASGNHRLVDACLVLGERGVG
jgi:hypothetical protein